MVAPNPCGTGALSLLISEMLTEIYTEDERILGQIVHNARCQIIQQYFPDELIYGPAMLYVLLGDPALRIKYGVIGVEEYDISNTEKVCWQTLGTQLRIPVAGKITVYSALGDVVIKDRIVQKGTRINLESGVYFVQVNTPNRSETAKVVIIE